MTNQTFTAAITNENIETAINILQGKIFTGYQAMVDLGLIVWEQYEGYIETALLIELTKGN